jgi:hypothetical protein
MCCNGKGQTVRKQSTWVRRRRQEWSGKCHSLTGSTDCTGSSRVMTLTHWSYIFLEYSLDSPDSTTYKKSISINFFWLSTSSSEQKLVGIWQYTKPIWLAGKLTRLRKRAQRIDPYYSSISITSSASQPASDRQVDNSSPSQ